MSNDSNGFDADLCNNSVIWKDSPLILVPFNNCLISALGFRLRRLGDQERDLESCYD